MIMIFKYGFEFEGFTFGWYEKELYRLPSISEDNKSYGLKKLPLIKVGSSDGYRIKRQKFSVKQATDMTTIINKKITVIRDNKHIPA